MNATPNWALSVLYGLHLLATVAWVGGLAGMAWLVTPALHKVLKSDTAWVLQEQLQTRLQGITWFALAVLTATGLFQMSANPNYKGFLAIANPWAVAILLKHITFGGMVLASLYTTWWVRPALHRAIILKSAGRDTTQEIARLQQRQNLIARINLGLAIVILAFTAFARAQ